MIAFKRKQSGRVLAQASDGAVLIGLRVRLNRLPVGRRVSPHPDPLPQGEGTNSTTPRRPKNARLVEPLHTILPLPKGEGRGEGKGNVVHPAISSVCTALLFLVAINAILPRASAQQLDETWTVTVGTQVVQVNPDGTFRIPNIPAPDQFGPEGPGSRPDFLSDDFLRVTGFSTVNGKTRYAFSDPFQIKQGETFRVQNLTFTDLPPPLTSSIAVDVETPALTQIGQTTQLKVTAALADGSSKDVTPRTGWTVYRISNTNVATVGRDGLVTAVGRGMAFITVVNEGTTAVAQVDVSPGDELTTVSGFVQRVDGSPVVGIPVSLVGVSGAAVTQPNGSYDIPGVATGFGISGAVAISNEGESVFGFVGELEPIGSGITDGGVITVQTLCEARDGDCQDSDGDCLPDDVEIALGLDPQNPDSDGNSTRDGDEDSDNDGLTNCMEVFLKTNLTVVDTDSDGLIDGNEVFRAGTSPIRPDTDLDFILDGEEVVEGEDGFLTNPLRNDTDRDGWNDEMEVTDGSDPLDPLSRPRIHVIATPVVSLVRPVYLAPVDLGAAPIVANPIVSLVRPDFLKLDASTPGDAVAKPVVTIEHGN